jgi:NADPH:quinone reductase-like Zn-dependent oxidoreductase
MRAVTYTRPGDPSVLEIVERPTPEPGAGEIRIRLLVSGVNPTDAQEYTVVPAERACPLPATADFDLGDSIGIPAVTAPRAIKMLDGGELSLYEPKHPVPSPPPNRQR